MTLLAELIPEQESDLTRNGGFNVRGSDGEIYRILALCAYEPRNNVLGYINGALGRLGRWPLHEGVYVIGTTCYLSQKVHLECAAEVFVENCCSVEYDKSDKDLMMKMGDYKGKI